MSKHWRTVDHTADLGLAARADSLGGLFEALAEGLARQVHPDRPDGRSVTREIAVTAEAVEPLLVNFLWQVMAAAQYDGLVIGEARVSEVSATAATAVLAGERFDPRRHEFGTEIKAVTYHGLTVGREDDTWTATVLLDL